jgi:hypothetical protein
LEKKGEPAFKQALVSLTPELQLVQKKAMPISWVPMAQVADIIEKSAPLIYPGEKNGIYKLGMGEAADNLKGVYKIFMRVVSVAFVIEQASKLWATYHNEGQARAATLGGEKQGEFWVENYALLPPSFVEFMCGYIAGAVEMTGAKQVRVAHEAPKPGS